MWTQKLQNAIIGPDAASCTVTTETQHKQGDKSAPGLSAVHTLILCFAFCSAWIFKPV